MNNCGIYNFDLVIPIKTKTKKTINEIKYKQKIESNNKRINCIHDMLIYAKIEYYNISYSKISMLHNPAKINKNIS